jgi:hypothetical protein
MNNIHEEIESFLLPGTDMRYLPLNQRASKDISDSPFSRLDHIMYQVALADHIRTLQIMYRDGEDDQRLASELREGDSQGIPLTTKHLMEKICEGRSRAAALCRLCYGEDTLESLRAWTDLGSSYALQGMWPQVNDHVSMASQKLLSLSSSKEIMEGINLRIVAGRRAAARVDLCFRVLRTHAMAHQGHVSHIFMRELMVELSTLPDGVECGTELITEMHEYFERFSVAQRGRDGKSPSSRSNQSPQSQSQSQQPARRFPSWGDMVKYLREENEIMKQWLQEMEGAILPQNKAAMHLPFRACDEQKRGIAHPAQLSATIMKYSSALKVIAGTTLLKQLNQMKIEVPLVIDQRTGRPVESEDRGGDGDGSPLAITPVSPENIISVVYELPVAWEEVLSKHILEGSYNTLEMIRAQVLTLLGVSQVFGNKLDLAEENLKDALKQLEKIGLEMEITACELYNSIAQLMITKHRRWDSSRTSQMKKDAMFWVTNTPEGRGEVQRRYDKMEQHFRKRHLSYSIVELEMRARNAVLRSRLKKLAGEDPPEDPTRKAIEAAYR